MAVLKSAGLKADRPISELTDSEMKTLSYTLSDWKFDELAPTEWKQAQTTGGGVRLSQLEPDSFMLKGYPGLYLVGETLDCAGNCGGYNLHFAFGSGIVAGTHAGKQRI